MKFRLTFLAFCLFFLPVSARAATFTVSKTADTNDGVCDTDCSLREALDTANNADGDDSINFDIPGAGPHTIQLSSMLPQISSNIDIDGPSDEKVTVRGEGSANPYRIFSTSGSLVASISRLTITNGYHNSAGGGVYNDSTSTLTLTDCTISVNAVNASADGFGGGIYNSPSGALTLTNCAIVDNSVNSPTGGYGGGIYNSQSGTLTLTNCTLDGNYVIAPGIKTGGGIDNEGLLTLDHCTITRNNAGVSGQNRSGGGISTVNGTLTMNNSIVANNESGGVGPDIYGTVNSGDYNLVKNTKDATLSGTHNITNVDPLLGPDTDNGGPTPTRALHFGSPAIDAGNSSLTTDQRGFTRPIDPSSIPNALGGNGSDIGAFELVITQNATNLVVSKTADTNDGVCNADCSLREAVNAANNTAGYDIITFAGGVTGTITLGGSHMLITENVTITGPGAKVLTINGNNASRMFTIESGTATISGLTFTGGRVTGDGGFGGAITVLNYGGLRLLHCTFNNNFADIAGGAISSDSRTSIPWGTGVIINNCTFANNIALTIRNAGASYSVGNGGAIVNSFGFLSISNSTFTGNDTGSKGGAIANWGDLTVNHCTITGNNAGLTGPDSYQDSFGGGIFHTSGTMTINNTIVANNTTARNHGPDINANSGSVNSGDYNLVEDSKDANLSGTHNIIGVDPLLGALADNGGPTPTHALLSGSPAINAGDPSFTGSGLFDQRGPGFPRVRSGRLDIGAYEVQNLSPVNVSLNPVNVGSDADEERLVTTEQIDADGHSDIEYSMIEIGSGSQIVRAYYNKAKNKLYLLDESNSSYIGGFVPGSSNIISNSRGSLNCENTVVVTNGNSLTIIWAFTLKSAMAGPPHVVKLLVRDLVGQRDGWENMGTWSIGSQAPVNVSLTPDSLSSPAGEERVLTSVHSDADGHGDLEYSMIEVGSGSNILRAYYHKVKHKLYLLNESNSGYMGGFTPGSANIISNSRGSLNCANTVVSASGNTLTINWAFTPTSAMVGSNRPVKLLVRDLSGQRDGWENMGSWTITSAVGGLMARSREEAAPSEPVEVMEATASTSANSITIEFAGAVPSGEFAVASNGEDVKPKSVEINGKSVTLLLPEGALQAGDEVTVTWKGGTTAIKVE